MNYQTLTAAILAESMRTDLTSQMPLFVSRAGEMIARELRASEMLSRVSLGDADLVEPLVPGVYLLPDDWLEDRTIFYARTPLRKLSPAAIGPLLGASFPVAYTVRGTSDGLVLEVGGSPGPGDTIDCDYFARPADLVATTDTNRLLTNHPAVYTDAALFYLYRFTQDLELAQAALDTWTHTRDTLNEQAGRFLAGSQAAPKYNLGRFKTGGRY